MPRNDFIINHQDFPILMIAEGTSYINMTIRDKLTEAGFPVEVREADFGALRRIGTTAKVIFIYASPSIMEKTTALQEIRNRAIQSRVPIFILANKPEDLEIVEQSIPKHIFLHQFTRPIDFLEMVAQMEADLTSPFGRARKKILAVDDSGTMLRNIKTWLGEEYDVTVANSAFVAIKCICTDKPDLMLLDYEMPVCDGPQLMKMLRSEIDYENLPIIFLTGKNDRESITQVMSLLPAGYILKSNGAQGVKSTVHRFFNPE